jgi:alpha-D-ribose 1-methylphosphonate 5-triphosphate synthase subunit PhnL
MTAALHASALVKRFGGEEPVLCGATLAVAPGSLTLVDGAPGAGKSTLLRCLAGSYRLDGGAVRLSAGSDELLLADADARTVAWLRRHHLRLVDGALRASPSDHALEVAARSLEHAGAAREAAERQAERLLDRLALGGAAATPVGLLPQGARRALAVGRSLVHPPAVLLLDEPLRAVPERAVPALVELIRAARSAGTAMLAVDRRDDALAAIADHIHQLQEGTLA